MEDYKGFRICTTVEDLSCDEAAIRPGVFLPDIHVYGSVPISTGHSVDEVDNFATIEDKNRFIRNISKNTVEAYLNYICNKNKGE